MKLTIKLLLIVVLFCGTALAEGEIGGGGGYAPPPCTPNCPPPPCEDEELCIAMPAENPWTKKASDSALIYISKLVISILE